MLGKILILAAAGLLPVAILGCEHHHYDEPASTVAYEPVPAGYTYYNDPYYYQGHYDNNYWYWRDQQGRSYREGREEHERHVHEHPRYEHHDYDDHRDRDHHEYDRH
jgi:hypothetical protein